MSKNETDVLAPPYTSASVFAQFIDLLSKKNFDSVSIKQLQSNGLTAGKAYSLFLTLRSLELIDGHGKVLNPQTLIEIGVREHRTEALKKVVERSYKELLETIPIEDATIEKVSTFFRMQKVKPSIATKSARFFLWIAKEAGYKVGKEFKPYKLGESKSGVGTNQKVVKERSSSKKDEEKSTSNTKKDTDLSAEDYEEKLLNILLEKINSVNELPDPQLLAQIRELIEAKKQADDSKHRHATNAPAPSSKKEIGEA